MSSKYELPDKEQIKSDYEKLSPVYKKLIQEIIYIVEKIIQENKFQVSNIQSRVKTFDSYYKKIVRNEINEDFFNEIEDFAGIRIIFPYRSDLIKINSIIKKKFRLIRENLHNSQSMPFGYMSDHYIIKISKSYRGDRYDDIKDLKCELQIRTVSMHAWATVSHHLEYKQEVDIPSELKSDFMALSGVFYIADSLFEQFKTARETSQNKLRKSIKTNIFNLKQEVNLDTLRAFLLWKLPDRPKNDDYAYSELVGEIKQANFNDFEKLNEILDEHMDDFLLDEKKHPPIERTSDPKISIPTTYSHVGVVRVICRDIANCEGYPVEEIDEIE